MDDFDALDAELERMVAEAPLPKSTGKLKRMFNNPTRLRGIELSSVRRGMPLDIIDDMLRAGVQKCSMCGEVKPFSEFHVQRRKNILSGRRSACKNCFNESIRKKRAQDRSAA